ncbi:EEIG1/EHBP1 N-terminal domain [Cocos nucifera]|uniref:EEIG1/EHBP1 N-terminal domain n=1 Tax=Cocos nucifera TaxID=13894 RepID=A0A8K0I4T9_COCNU|nr:EEIG1/EHBP1 N-terminal domain [Cocos nucifera]
MSFKLHLIIHEIGGLPIDKLEDCGESSLVVQIGWRGSGRKSSFFPTAFRKNCTSKQPIHPNGVASWDEGFDQTCKLKRKNSRGFRSWIINLEIQEYDQDLEVKVVAKTEIDIGEFAPVCKEKRIGIPIMCNIKGQTTQALLKVEFHFVELQTKGSNAFLLPRAFSLRSFSCTGFPQNYDNRNQNPTSSLSKYLSEAETSSDDEPELNYWKLSVTNILLVDQFNGKIEDHKDEKDVYLQESPARIKQQPSVVRILSWNKKAKVSSKAVNYYRGAPLLNKACSEDGGDDIDKERRQSIGQFSALSLETEVRAEGKPQTLGFEDDGRFEVGNWQKKRVVSRDGQMELVTDIFLASIDQRSEKAAGGSACTVIAVVIADWLHNNPKTLPLRCQFDELVREGSLEWRKLCADENHNGKFSDHHFDLDTVLEAKIRPLSEVTKMSYVGFFSLDDMPDSLEFLQGAMSFDTIWKELTCGDESEERVYIASWNDHFFVLKIEKDAIYLIDTFGERLFEGCNQAYILKFSKESMVYGRRTDSGSQNIDSDECTENIPHGEGTDEDDDSSKEVVCEGTESCKQYIKEFLAALPLRELQNEIKRGVVEEAILHRHLQIEFHYTAPLLYVNLEHPNQI